MELHIKTTFTYSFIMKKSKLELFFNRLDYWRNFPKYSLETRVDVLFSLFLPRVLVAELDALSTISEGSLKIIPEFPIHKQTLHRELSEDHSSYNVDFAVFSPENSTCVLVELKTDMYSLQINGNFSTTEEELTNSQFARYVRAKRLGLKKLVNGIIQIFNSPSVRKGSHRGDRKYGYLLQVLESLNLLEPNDIRQFLYEDYRIGLTDARKGLKVPDSRLRDAIC